MGGLFGSWAGAGSGANYALSAAAVCDFDFRQDEGAPRRLLAEKAEQCGDYRLGRIFLHQVTRIRHAA